MYVHSCCCFGQSNWTLDLWLEIGELNKSAKISLFYRKIAESRSIFQVSSVNLFSIFLRSLAHTNCHENNQKFLLVPIARWDCFDNFKVDFEYFVENSSCNRNDVTYVIYTMLLISDLTLIFFFLWNYISINL